MRLRVRHVTLYDYTSEVSHSHQLLHMTPRETPNQICLKQVIRILPLPDNRKEEMDAFGNRATRVEIDKPYRRLRVIADMHVEMIPRAPVNAAATDPWEHVRDSLRYRCLPGEPIDIEAARFRHESPYVRVKKSFTEFSAACFPAGRPILECADALMAKLHKEIEYAPGTTTTATPLVKVLERKRGVCQDFAHLMIACLRSHGLAARYVSGYLRTGAIRSDGRARTDDATTAKPAWAGADASHAWVAVHCPPAGWIELDPTNNLRVGTDHIAVAWGRDFGDVSPLRGVILGGGNHQLSVGVKVQTLG